MTNSSTGLERHVFAAKMPLACLSLACGLALGLLAWQRHRATRPVDVAGWDVVRLEEHLRRRGLPLHRTSTMREQETVACAYLSTDPVEFAQVNRLVKRRERLDDWRGIVYCEIIPDFVIWSDEEREGRDCTLRRGQFFFFGDPSLIARIEKAMTQSE
jgi:hypothetical protein